MKPTLFVIFALILSSCAGLKSTYKPSDFSGGYGEDKIRENVYVVHFDGNGFTSKETAKKYFLRRSSQITLKNGFNCFKVLDEKYTLSQNFMSKNAEALGTKYYYKNDYELMDGEKNKLDENSVTGIIQILPTAAPECYDAKTTLASSSIED